MSLYGALLIMCQHIYVHSIAFLRVKRLCLRESHQFQLSSVYELHLVGTRGPGALPTGVFYPQYVLIVFSVCRIQISQLWQLCGPWAKVAYLHFISSLCALHIYDYHQLYQILFILSTSKSICLYSVPVIQFSLSVPVQQVQYILTVSIFLDSVSVISF